MTKLPALQFYPGDWKKDTGVQALTFEQRGVWFEMLLLMHDSEERGRLLLNGKPTPVPVLARQIGIDQAKLKQILSTMLEYGVYSVDKKRGGLMYSRRMVNDEALRQKKVHAGGKGGRERDRRQKAEQELSEDDSKPPSKTQAEPKQKGGSSVSVSSSASTKGRGAFVPPTLDQVKAYAKEQGYDMDCEAWMAHYQSNGWKVGKNPMKLWEGAVTTWAKRTGFSDRPGGQGQQLDNIATPDQSDYIAAQDQLNQELEL